ncbi:hypothetical protein [Bosea sp. BK604]|uniref:hypothetical protein n=1 Tax=Bosea sp. BK604 TaxID=2512180 RepID=UPI0010D9A1BA|nr:hypothetical protein [Bosea sp. BK604]TCR70471.1 hypothetical protein EV560_101878 [Bosea sp. BK604]
MYIRVVVTAGEPGHVVKLSIHVPSLDALYRMVQSGLGVALIPNRAFEAPGFLERDVVVEPCRSEN